MFVIIDWLKRLINMTKREAATYLGVSEHVLRNMISRNKIKVDILNKIIPEELEKLKIEIEERRNIS